MSDSSVTLTCIKPNDFPAKMIRDKCEGIEPLYRNSYIRKIDKDTCLNQNLNLEPKQKQ